MKEHNMKKKNIKERKIKDLFKDRKGISADEERDLEQMYEILLNEDIPEPPDSLDDRFYSLLKDLNSDGKRNYWTRLSGLFESESFRISMRIAAGIALFIIGWFGARITGSTQQGEQQLAELTREVTGLRQSLVLTMLTKDSPSERIQAVNMVSEMNDVDSKIIESMLSTLNNDPNDNVRLVALETLTLYVDYPEVREGLIRSITRQESPLIQFRLAEIMQALQEKKAVPEFQKVLDDLTLDYSVRERINETIEVLL